MIEKQAQETKKTKSYKKQSKQNKEKSSRQNAKYNYYEMQLKLRELKYKLQDYKIANIDELWKLDLLIAEIRAFIFNNEILKTEYLKRVNNFYEKATTKKYRENAQYIYENIVIKQIEEQALKQNRIIKCRHRRKSYINYADVYVNDTANKNRFFKDRPLYYIYPSVLSPFADLTEATELRISVYADTDFKYVNIAPNVMEFYSNIDKGLLKIAYCLPNDIDFCISSITVQNLLNTFFDAIFYMYLIASALCGVLLELDNFLAEKINNEYYNMNIPIYNSIDLNMLMHKKESQYNLLIAVNKNPKANRDELANKLHTSPYNVDKQCQEICKLYNMPEGETKGLNTIRKLVQKIFTN